MIYYLAYGSNLHPLRLSTRISSARLIGNVALHGYAMSFSKRGDDGSGKCRIFATTNEDAALCALYSLAATQLPILDAIEGLGYEHKTLTVECNTTTYESITYMAQAAHINGSLKPHHWYKRIVLAGVNYHGFPASYVDEILAVESLEDPDQQRRQKNALLLTELAKVKGPDRFTVSAKGAS